MVDRPGFEPGTEACKATVFPTIPTAHETYLLAEHVGIEPTHPLLNDGLAIHCLNRSANAPHTFGRSTRIRTLDLIVPNDANYRAVLHSE